jgi:hypothetical protein
MMDGRTRTGLVLLLRIPPWNGGVAEEQGQAVLGRLFT